MAFDDKLFGTIFPTRSGTPTGTTNERQMLDAIGGSEGFRTRIRTGPDGVKTMVRTKNGMPHFSNEPAEKTTEEAETGSGYMETGELTWTFPGVSVPTRLDPATWRLHNVPTDARWLGKIGIDGEQKLPQPTPIDSGILRDSIDSMAIGYQRLPDADKDATRKDEYASTTVLKKIVAGIFPPEMFSGKLRYFMQCQYGAKAVPNQFFFTVEGLGEGALLQYQPTIIEGAKRIQFYFWAHATTGMFCAADYTYYLIQVVNSGRPGYMSVVGYPIRLSAFGKSLRKALLAGKIEQLERGKAEGYMFADAVIDTSKEFTIGSFPVGSCGRGGGTLAWGWKFNQSGEKISIVRVGAVGDEVLNTLDGRARETHVTLTRNGEYDGTEDSKWQVSAYDNEECAWQDGWGNFNIFVPTVETSTELVLFSYRATWGTAPAYAFSGVPIYGFYDASDEWKLVRISADAPNPSVVYTQEQSNLVLRGSLVVPDSYADNGNTLYDYDKNDNSGILTSNGSASYRKEAAAIGQISKFTLGVGEWSYVGERRAGSYEKVDWTLSGGSTGSFNHGFFPQTLFVSGTAWPANSAEDALWEFIRARSPFWESDGIPYWTGFQQYYSTDEFHNNQATSKTLVMRRSTGSFDRSHRWVLIIPTGDCSAVHVATDDYRYDDESFAGSFTRSVTASWETRVKELLVDGYTYEGNIVEHTFEIPYTLVSAMQEGSVTVLTPEPENIEENIAIKAWSLTLDAKPGTPSGSYTSMFSASRSSPKYNGLMRFRESALGKYYGTEGYNSGGVFANSLFVGWY